MINDQPFFSILIPSYNRPNYIICTISSILSNSFKDFEIIVSDDNSPEYKAIKKLISPLINSKLRFYKQEINLKEPGNKNFLVDKAKGKFNIFLGDDDLFYKDTLQNIYNYIVLYPNYDLYSIGYTLIDEHSKKYYSCYSPRKLDIELNSKYFLKYMLYFDSLPFSAFHPATFCCRNGIEKRIKYSEKVGIGEDFLFLIDFFNNNYKMLLLPFSGFMWRKVLSKNINYQINQSMGNLSNIHARVSILKNLSNRNNLSAVIRNILNTYNFRKRFLYYPMLREGVCDNKIQDLGLGKSHWHEYLSIKRYEIRSLNIFNSYLKRLFMFYSIFGIAGLYNYSKRLYQKLSYKSKS